VIASAFSNARAMESPSKCGDRNAGGFAMAASNDNKDCCHASRALMIPGSSSECFEMNPNRDGP
jgi:hypothetical protein